MTTATLKPLLSFSGYKIKHILTEQQKQFLPTTIDVDFFQQHGWFITPKIIPEQLIDDIFAATEELYAGKKDAELPIKNCCNWQEGDVGGIRNNEYISFQKKAFHQLTLQPIIGAIAARLIKTKAVRHFQDQLVSKEPKNKSHTSKVGWHTDRSYHSNCTSGKLLTVWIPLHDIAIEHGPLVMVDGSHQWTATDNLRGFNHDNHLNIEQRFKQQGRDFKKVPILLKKGQISFHHSSIIHGSFQNNSQIIRRVVVINLQNEENRYRTYWNNGKQIHHCLDKLCRKQGDGLPDYTDPAVFPVIWSEV